MRPSRTPTAFRTPVRHYHRRNSRSGDWDSWVGRGSSSLGRSIGPLGILLVIAAVAATVVAAYLLWAK